MRKVKSEHKLDNLLCVESKITPLLSCRLYWEKHHWENTGQSICPSHLHNSSNEIFRNQHHNSSDYKGKDVQKNSGMMRYWFRAEDVGEDFRILIL